jgi:hypothetical protein
MMHQAPGPNHLIRTPLRIGSGIGRMLVTAAKSSLIGNRSANPKLFYFIYLQTVGSLPLWRITPGGTSELALAGRVR